MCSRICGGGASNLAFEKDIGMGLGEEETEANSQYHELPRLQRQHRQQGEGDNEQGDSGEVETAENQKSIPPTHYAAALASVSDLGKDAVAEEAIELMHVVM